ncbi:MAG: type II toxin-antitoxin system PemK/MazF family toxin [bacterium]|nr:type II toxin-antitoxin system PemK/MazF family toxin [bacterium]
MSARNGEHGLNKKSVADCLQTRPIDHRSRFVKMRGSLENSLMKQIDRALKIVFELR